MAKRWTGKQEESLKANFKKMSIEQLAKKFGVSESSIKTKMSRLGLKKGKKLKTKKMKATGTAGRMVAKSKIRKKPVTRDTMHDNIRCRSCLIVDGYTKKEDTCRHCGAKLFKGDVL